MSHSLHCCSFPSLSPSLCLQMQFSVQTANESFHSGSLCIRGFCWWISEVTYPSVIPLFTYLRISMDWLMCQHPSGSRGPVSAFFKWRQLLTEEFNKHTKSDLPYCSLLMVSSCWPTSSTYLLKQNPTPGYWGLWRKQDEKILQKAVEHSVFHWCGCLQ